MIIPHCFSIIFESFIESQASNRMERSFAVGVENSPSMHDQTSIKTTISLAYLIALVDYTSVVTFIS